MALGLTAACLLATGSFGPTSAEAAEKRHILVIGDSLAGELWIGLYEAYRGDKTVSVKRYTKISSGVVRYDFYDWGGRAEILAKERKIDIAIMMIGGNDGQPIRVEGKRYREKVGTDLWKKTYGDRVEALIRTFASRGIRLYWVGMPIQRSRRDDAVGRTINELFRARSELLHTRYIDIYDMFADKRGKYSTHGTDDRGKRRRMRHRDGMHFSNSGTKWLGRVIAKIIAEDDAAEKAAASAEAVSGSSADQTGAASTKDQPSATASDG